MKYAPQMTYQIGLVKVLLEASRPTFQGLIGIEYPNHKKNF
jgi:hypothetical protein